MVLFKGILKNGKSFNLKTETFADLFYIFSCVSLSYFEELKNVTINGE